MAIEKRLYPHPGEVGSTAIELMLPFNLADEEPILHDDSQRVRDLFGRSVDLPCLAFYAGTSGFLYLNAEESVKYSLGYDAPAKQLAGSFEAFVLHYVKSIQANEQVVSYP